ncbi:MAG: hypothetical protein LBC56_08165 [Oscillospiraceae bacterium]|jgi:hypothetical protein|nr:hypothetical protein [Oscillospiraceae bacterium]
MKNVKKLVKRADSQQVQVYGCSCYCVCVCACYDSLASAGNNTSSYQNEAFYSYIHVDTGIMSGDSSSN